MFKNKQPKLFDTTTAVASTNAFIKAGLKKASKTTSLGNGAVKLLSSNNEFVNQFGMATNYKAPRSFEDIAKDMHTLWGINPEKAIKFTLYLRMITRKVQFADGRTTETTQRGQGLKHESIFRMMWIAINHPDVFWNNVELLIAVGSWKDIIQMLSIDLQYNGWKDKILKWDYFGAAILAGLENPKTSELVKKYLPKIRAKSLCKTIESQADTMIGKWICSLIFGTKLEDYSSYKKYRLLKSSGTAHQWQQLISKGKFLEIDFNSVHGRALSQLVSGKFLANRGLEAKYQAWIEAKPVAKYTGYVYELFSPLGTSNHQSSAHLKKYQVDTINAQFMKLVEVAKQGLAGANQFVGVLDTSGSMSGVVPGAKVSAYSVGKGLCLFFSYLLEGAFSNVYFEFSDECIMKEWKGDTPVSKLCNDNSEIVRGTNFQSIAKNFKQIKKKGVPESEFPKGIVCFSDGCFNSTGNNKTNFKTLLKSLREDFSDDFVDNFKVVLWDIPNYYYGRQTQTAFEGFDDTPNLYHISGLDAAALGFITGVDGQSSLPKNSEELFEAAMNQEVLSLVRV